MSTLINIIIPPKTWPKIVAMPKLKSAFSPLDSSFVAIRHLILRNMQLDIIQQITIRYPPNGLEEKIGHGL